MAQLTDQTLAGLECPAEANSDLGLFSASSFGTDEGWVFTVPGPVSLRPLSVIWALENAELLPVRSEVLAVIARSSNLEYSRAVPEFSLLETLMRLRCLVRRVAGGFFTAPAIQGHRIVHFHFDGHAFCVGQCGILVFRDGMAPYDNRSLLAYIRYSLVGIEWNPGPTAGRDLIIPDPEKVSFVVGGKCTWPGTKMPDCVRESRNVVVLADKRRACPACGDAVQRAMIHRRITWRHAGDECVRPSSAPSATNAGGKGSEVSSPAPAALTTAPSCAVAAAPVTVPQDPNWEFAAYSMAPAIAATAKVAVLVQPHPEERPGLAAPEIAVDMIEDGDMPTANMCGLCTESGVRVGWWQRIKQVARMTMDIVCRSSEKEGNIVQSVIASVAEVQMVSRQEQLLANPGVEIGGRMGGLSPDQELPMPRRLESAPIWGDRLVAVEGTAFNSLVGIQFKAETETLTAAGIWRRLTRLSWDKFKVRQVTLNVEAGRDMRLPSLRGASMVSEPYGIQEVVRRRWFIKRWLLAGLLMGGGLAVGVVFPWYIGIPIEVACSALATLIYTRVYRDKTMLHVPSLTLAAALDNMGQCREDYIANAPNAIRRNVGQLNIPTAVLASVVSGTLDLLEIAYDTDMGFPLPATPIAGCGCSHVCL